MEEAIAMTITSTIDDRIANKCITTKIKDVLSGRGVAMARVVGLGSDGANVMVGRKAGVAQKMRLNDCPYLVNIHCGAHRTALAARDASKASLERAVKGIRANWVALVLELQEEEAARDCPVAKGIRMRLRTLMFPALTHLLTDILAVFCGITLTRADAQTFSRVRTEYIAEITKSIKKRFPLEHVGIIADLDTVINASCYPVICGESRRNASALKGVPCFVFLCLAGE
ncbi:hypothetical protein F7725_028287 [Dissostichus mawsoni]|uniref:Uncharacterized protein n=1 Tax=Dissostichus mawsoni TaxID=36200 RepID=A0A7J5XGI8_DISMA|nr:hypothetical protein F7725_028287 [Dissostichus mawsoni]